MEIIQTELVQENGEIFLKIQIASILLSEVSSHVLILKIPKFHVTRHYLTRKLDSGKSIFLSLL